MPTDLLIAARDISSHQKGNIVQVRDSAEVDGVRPWGNAQWLPNFVIGRVTDIEVDAVRHAMRNVFDSFDWELVQTFAQGRRYKVSIPANRVTLGAKIRSKVKEGLESSYAAVHRPELSDHDAGYAVFDIPNTDWNEMRDWITTEMRVLIVPRRYKVPDTIVDTIAAYMTANDAPMPTTKAQVTDNLIDRLA